MGHCGETSDIGIFFSCELLELFDSGALERFVLVLAHVFGHLFEVFLDFWFLGLELDC